MKNMVRQIPLFLGLAWAVLLCACNLEQTSDAQYLSLRVDSTLTQYDRVTITLLSPEGDTLEKVWNGHLDNDSALARIEVKKYRGGPVKILIVAEQGDKIVYIRLLHYTGEGKPKADTLPLPDYRPPVLTLSLSDTLEIFQYEAFRDSVACEDDRDPHPVTVITGKVDESAIGSYNLEYGCKDSSGNASPLKHRIVRVRAHPDTVSPRITLAGPDSLVFFAGGTYADAGATCADDRDRHPVLAIAGKVNADSAASYRLDFTCADSAGNRAPPKKKDRERQAAAGRHRAEYRRVGREPRFHHGRKQVYGCRSRLP